MTTKRCLLYGAPTLIALVLLCAVPTVAKDAIPLASLENVRGSVHVIRRGRALAVYSAGCFTLAWQLEMWHSLPFLYLFLHGYVFMALLSFSPDRLLRFRYRPPAKRRTAET